MMRISKKHWQKCLAATLTGLTVSLAQGDSLYQNDETFHAEFIGEPPYNNNAVHASGSASAAVILQSQTSRDINPITAVNEGLKVGNGNASLSYETANNLPAAVGSIEVRFKSIDWNFSPGANYVTVFQAGTGGGVILYIYKYSNMIAVYLKINDNTSFFISKNINTPNELWANQTYHHVAATYNVEGDIVFYVDGSEAGRTPMSTTDIVWPSTFTVGPSFSGFGYADGQTTIERVRIYDVALNAEAVSYLAAGTEFNYNIGRTSDWIKTGRPQLNLDALDKNTVPIPWSNVSYSAGSQSASCWNRTYSFADANLLAGVNSDSVNLLNGPATLQTQSGALSFGVPAVVSADTGSGRLVFNRTVSVNDSLISGANLKCTLEYDGLLWCELTGLPSSGLTYLKLTVPYKKDASELTHYVGAPATNSGVFSPGSSYSKSLPLTTGVLHQSELKTMVWVGNTRHGVLWCMESDQYWWPKDRNDCIKLERLSDGTLNLDIAMVSSSLPAGAPQTLNYNFGLMGTPVKSTPQGWRDWTHNSHYSGITGDRRGTNVFYWGSDLYAFMPFDFDPTRYMNITEAQTIIANDVAGTPRRYILPYWNRNSFRAQYIKEGVPTGIHPEASLFTNEWGKIPNKGDTTNYFFQLSNTTGWSDYLTWCLDYFAEVLGHSDGFYLDEVFPVPNTRSESNGGYDSLDSTRRPTFEMFGTRNLIKRLVHNTYVRNNERPRGLAHCSATQTMNTFSGCDMLLIGEQYNIGYLWANPELKPPAGDDIEKFYYYSYALPMDRLRAECFGRQWGEVMAWLPQLKGQDTDIINSPLATRDMLSRVMQADMVICPFWCNSEEIYKTWTFRKNYNIGDDDVEFHPYWEQAQLFVNSTDLLGWWKLNDGSGITAIDHSGSDHDGTFVNAPSWTDGIAGKAMYLSNNGGYLDCGNIVELNTLTTYSISGWIRPDTTGIATRHIVETLSGSTTGFLMQLYSNDKLYCYQSVNGSIYNLYSYVPFSHDGQYHHVVMTFNHDAATTANTLKTYIDGVCVATATCNGTPYCKQDGVPLSIGRGAFTGVIDDVKIFSKTLSAAEVNEEYLKIRQTVSLKFDDATGSIAADSSSYGINGTLVNMDDSNWADDDIRSIHFNNDGGYVTCGTNPLFASSSYTVECMIRPDTTGIITRHIVEALSGSTAGFLMQLNDYNNLHCYQSVNGSIYNLHSYAAFPHDGQYHHVAMTFNYDAATTANTLKTYIDGVCVATATFNGTPNLTASDIPMNIGHGAYSGDIKDFGFHRRILTDAEIAVKAVENSGEPEIVIGYYRNSSNEYLALVSNLSRVPRNVLVDFGKVDISSLKDAEDNSVLQRNSNGKLLLNMNRNDYRSLRINY